MSNEQVNKVDLSLDEIIKLNKKQRQQRSRGGSSMSQGKAGGRGQGVGGRRNSRGRRGGSGISPLKRKQTGTGSNVGGSRGQPAGRRGQRGNLRGWAGNRGGLRRGGSVGSRGGSRGGSSASSISSSLSANTRGSRGRGNQRGARGSLRGVLRGRGSALLQGKARGGGGFQAGPGQAAAKRVSIKQKRQMAIQALQQARKTIAQLDQQSARQNFVNLRRGIVQQNQLLATDKKTGLYSSSASLSSASSQVSVGSGRQLQGTKITAFSPPSSPQSTRGRRRWRPKSQAANQPISTSTLTISIDNPAPLSTDFSVPQVSVPAPRQRQRRRPWRRQNSDSSFDELDMNRGATPNFSSQLAKLKPTVSTKYVFQKKAFSTANTPVSLNDRFSGSGSEDLIGRKVFM